MIEPSPMPKVPPQQICLNEEELIRLSKDLSFDERVAEIVRLISEDRNRDVMIEMPTSIYAFPAAVYSHLDDQLLEACVRIFVKKLDDYYTKKEGKREKKFTPMVDDSPRIEDLPE